MTRTILKTICLISCLSIPVWISAPATVQGQIVDDQIILSEFFEELYSVDTVAGLAFDILDTPSGTPSPFGQLVEVLDSDTVIISDFADLHRYDVGTQSTSYWTTLDFVPAEITRDLNGNLIAVGTEGVWRIDGTTGTSSLVHDQTFFGTDDAVVDTQGNIFVTEFFESLGVVGPNGSYIPIGDFGANEFAHLDLGHDGNLYLSSTFGGEFWRVDPNTGASLLLGSDQFTFMDDIQMDDAGNILFSGVVDSLHGVFSFDPNTGVTTTLISGDDYNDGFFNGLDIDIYEGELRFGYRTAVPEPSSAAAIALLAVTGFCRRRR